MSVTWLRCLAHNSDQSLSQHQTVGVPLLVRNWQLQPFEKIPVYTYKQMEAVTNRVKDAWRP